MVVNTIMEIGKRKGAPVSSARAGSRAKVVNLSGEDMRRHERAMEYRRQADVNRANLESAMKALEVANADIARLNTELAKANAEIARLQSERAEKAKRSRSKKELPPAEAPEEQQ